MPTPKKHRISRQRQGKNCLDQNYSLTQLKQTWFSRALLMGQNLRLLAKSIELHDGIVTLLALDEVDFEEHKTSEIQRIIKKQASLFANPISENQETAFVNIVRMKQDFGFSEVEIQLLLFASILVLDGEFSECFEILERVSNRQFYRALHKILNAPENDIMQAFDKQGLLAKSGLLKINPAVDTIPDKLRLLKGISTTLLDHPNKPIADLFADYVRPAKAAELSAQDFEHIAPTYRRLRKYLRHAIEQYQPGCNILLYGPPGTGKTQMIRSLSAELKIDLYEISSEDAEGETLSGKERISACQLAQFLLQGKDVTG